MTPTGSDARIDVRKTYKLYIGGAFPRSESGRSYVVEDAKGKFLANASYASRKDARDAVVAAAQGVRRLVGADGVQPRPGALPGRRGARGPPRASSSTRSPQSEGASKRSAEAQVDAAIDRLVWYAGWADKIAQVVGGTNPVAAPYFNFSVPEPTGVVAVLAPQQSSLLGLVSVLAPVIVTGNTAVVACSADRPLSAVTLAEVLATSDVPGGVVNLLTGSLGDTAPTLASHMDVNAIDLTGVAGDPERATELEVLAADNLKRVLRAPATEPDWSLEPGIERMTAFLETKTVWHPIGI